MKSTGKMVNIKVPKAYAATVKALIPVERAKYMLKSGDPKMVDAINKFSRGEIDKHDAMSILGIDWYGDLLGLLGFMNLPLYRLPDEIARAQSDKASMMLFYGHLQEHLQGIVDLFERGGVDGIVLHRLVLVSQRKWCQEEEDEPLLVYVVESDLEKQGILEKIAEAIEAAGIAPGEIGDRRVVKLSEWNHPNKADKPWVIKIMIEKGVYFYVRNKEEG